MIKVLHIGLSSNRGGIENVVLSWLKNKPEDVVYDFVNDGKAPLAYEDEWIKAGGKIFYIPSRFSKPIARINALKKLIKKEKYNYVHMHIMYLDEPFPVRIVNSIKDCKIILHCHSMYDGHYTWKENLLLTEAKILLKGQKYLKLACSSDAGRFMFKNDFTVIENGIDLNRYSFSPEKRKEIRDKYNIKDDEFVVGHIGHVCPEKNYPFLIKSVAKLIKDNKNYKLMFIGDICYDEEIKQMLIENEILDKTILVGSVKDASSYYSAMDVFYLPSINEGFPLVLVEAQSSGLPCVASDVITKDTRISDYISYVPFDIDESVKALINLSITKNDRNKVLIDRKFDIKNSSKKMFDYYKENI